MKTTHALFDFKKRSSKRPTTKTAMAYLRRSYLIETFELSQQARYWITKGYIFG